MHVLLLQFTHVILLLSPVWISRRRHQIHSRPETGVRPADDEPRAAQSRRVALSWEEKKSVKQAADAPLNQSAAVTWRAAGQRTNCRRHPKPQPGRIYSKFTARVSSFSLCHRRRDQDVRVAFWANSNVGEGRRRCHQAVWVCESLCRLLHQLKGAICEILLY